MEIEITLVVNTKKYLNSPQYKRLEMLTQGYSLQQIADIEDCSVSAVWQSIESAKNKIKKLRPRNLQNTLKSPVK